jgi:hypothetical protein
MEGGTHVAVAEAFELLRGKYKDRRSLDEIAAGIVAAAFNDGQYHDADKDGLLDHLAYALRLSSVRCTTANICQCLGVSTTSVMAAGTSASRTLTGSTCPTCISMKKRCCLMLSV